MEFTRKDSGIIFRQHKIMEELQYLKNRVVEKVYNGFMFPDVFHTGVINKNASDDEILADGLCGWACCMARGSIPDKFGEGMAAIGARLGILGTPDSLSEYYKEQRGLTHPKPLKK